MTEANSSFFILNSTFLKEEALRLGFSHVGLAPAEPVDEAYMAYYEQWLRKGWQGEMHYLENHLALRRDPRLLLEGAKTVVSLAMSYNPGKQPTQPGIAWYAQGRDYHEVLRERLQQLVLRTLPLQTHPQPLPCREGSSYNCPQYSKRICPPPFKGGARGGSAHRICVDTAPILERYWAWRCGLGWIGRNRQLVIPDEGSAFFLAEILLTEEADVYDSPLPNGAILPPTGGVREGLGGGPCGNCDRCLRACPTGALTDEGIDARRCLSYLTIEHRGELPKEATAHLHTHFYGCDRCLRACPHLSHEADTIEDFRPSPELLSMTREDWASLTPEQYRQLFRGSAVKRAKYEGLMRNIEAASKREENQTRLSYPKREQARPKVKAGKKD